MDIKQLKNYPKGENFYARNKKKIVTGTIIAALLALNGGLYRDSIKRNFNKVRAFPSKIANLIKRDSTDPKVEKLEDRVYAYRFGEQKKEIKELTRVVTDLKKLYNQSQDEISGLMEEIEGLKTKPKYVDQTVKMGIFSGTNEAIGKKNQYQELQKKIEELTKKVNNSGKKDQYQPLKDEIVALKGKINDLEENSPKYQILQNRINELSGKIGNFEGNSTQYDILQGKIGKLTEIVNNYGRNDLYNPLKDKITALNGEMDYLKAKIKDLEKNDGESLTQEEKNHYEEILTGMKAFKTEITDLKDKQEKMLKALGSGTSNYFTQGVLNYPNKEEDYLKNLDSERKTLCVDLTD